MIQAGWEHYRTFFAVVREGTLSRAARSLGLSQPTVGRHIDVLERSLGVPLFRRSQAGLHPTDQALALAPHIETMAVAAEAFVRAASGKGDDERGSVRVTASEVVGTGIVTPLLRPFREAHPHVVIEMLLSSRTEDLLRGEADIAVRLFRPTRNALVARHVGLLAIGLHAHPSYLGRHGTPRKRADLRQHAIVGFDSEALLRRTAREGLSFRREELSFRSDSYLGQYAALRAGLGIGLSLVEMARRDGLVRVLPSVGASVELWLVMHEDLRTSRRVRLLYDFLAGALTDAQRLASTQTPPKLQGRGTRYPPYGRPT